MEFNEKDLIRSILAAQESSLPEDGFAKLESLLRKNAAARRVYLRLMQVQATLEASPFLFDEIERKSQAADRNGSPSFLVRWCARCCQSLRSSLRGWR